MKKIAYHLPQFHSTPENDKYWGSGFTEWTNLKTAKAFFPGHNIYHPAEETGYYNLLDEKSLYAQIELAKYANFSAFCFWHYDFGNGISTLREVPELFRRLDTSFPYMLSWVNTDWTGSWIGKNNDIIFKQQYDEESIKQSIKYFVKAFSEERYLKINGHPLFQVVYPDVIGLKNFYLMLESECKDSGIKTPYFIFPDIHCSKKWIESFIIDRPSLVSTIGWPPGDSLYRAGMYRIKSKLRSLGLIKGPIVVEDKKYYKKHISNEEKKIYSSHRYIPTVLTGWDNTPRYGHNGVVLHSTDGSSGIEDYFHKFSTMLDQQKLEHNLLFFKSWNEWAEGNMLEKDSISGSKRLDAIKKVFK